jgi:hypothetical protein
LITKEFFDSVLSEYVKGNPQLKVKLDDGSYFDAQELTPLSEVIVIRVKTEPDKPLISRFIPYERIMFVESFPEEKRGDIIDLLLNRNPEDDFQQVPNDTSVRPLLKYSDLNLVRRALIALVKYGTVQEDRSKAVDLFRRILRKVK